MYRMAIGVLTSAGLLLGGCSSMGTAQLRSPDGRLAPCADAPHCVSSQDAIPARRIEAIAYAGTREGAQQLLSHILKEMEGARIVSDVPGYIHATFTSKLFGFVDDLELQFPSQKWVDVRSSSRTGYYDLDANRSRVEAIRKAFNDRQP